MNGVLTDQGPGSAAGAPLERGVGRSRYAEDFNNHIHLKQPFARLVAAGVIAQEREPRGSPQGVAITAALARHHADAHPVGGAVDVGDP